MAAVHALSVVVSKRVSVWSRDDVVLLMELAFAGLSKQAANMRAFLALTDSAMTCLDDRLSNVRDAVSSRLLPALAAAPDSLLALGTRAVCWETVDYSSTVAVRSQPEAASWVEALKKHGNHPLVKLLEQ